MNPSWVCQNMPLFTMLKDVCHFDSAFLKKLGISENTMIDKFQSKRNVMFFEKFCFFQPIHCEGPSTEEPDEGVINMIEGWSGQFEL